MSVYADTSLLISYFIHDPNSASAQAVIHATTTPLPFTGLHRLEMRNALALGVFRRILTAAQVSAAWSDAERDLRSGRLVPQQSTGVRFIARRRNGPPRIVQSLAAAVSMCCTSLWQ